MKILVFTTLFPNSQEPIKGVFVKERVRHYGKDNDIVVVAPVPFQTKLKYRIQGKRIPYREMISSLEVSHPTFYYIPKYLKFLDGFFLFLSSLWCVGRIKNIHEFSIIDSHYCFPDGFAAVLLGKIFRVPVSITLRGNDVSLLPEFKTRKIMIQYALKNANYLISVSEWLKKKAEELMNNNNRIHVVMNSVDHEMFKPMDKLMAREKMGFHEDGKIVLSIGALIERKGFQHLIKAFHKVKTEYGAKLYLYIAGGHGGEKNFEPELRALVEELKLEGSVFFLGQVPHEKLVHLYNSSDLFCLFSEREGCPNVLMEATACGIPALVCGEWADRFMIPSDVVGYISPSRNISELRHYMSRALLKNWNKAAIRSYSVCNSWEKIGNRTQAIFTDQTERPIKENVLEKHEMTCKHRDQ